jgi:hypothetical protein
MLKLVKCACANRFNDACFSGEPLALDNMHVSFLDIANACIALRITLRDTFWLELW